MSAEENKVRLISGDGKEFEVVEQAVVLAETITRMLDDGSGGSIFPVPNVDNRTLAKILEYCNHHSIEKSKAENDEFDESFIEVDTHILHDLLIAANYLQITGLLNLCAEKIAGMIKGKTSEQIRRMLGIKNDFTPAEEEEFRAKAPWAFDY